MLSDGFFAFLNAYRSDFPEVGIKSPGRTEKHSNIAEKLTVQHLDTQCMSIRCKQDSKFPKDAEHSVGTKEVAVDEKEVLHKGCCKNGAKVDSNGEENE